MVIIIFIEITDNQTTKSTKFQFTYHIDVHNVNCPVKHTGHAPRGFANHSGTLPEKRNFFQKKKTSSIKITEKAYPINETNKNTNIPEF